MVVLPFYLVALVPLDVRFMRVFRLFAVLKLTRYQASMKILGDVLRDEARPIAAALFVLIMLPVVVSSLAYMAENAAQPEAFGSIPDAMYWAVTTMTTVGYGDVVPVTPLGKVLAGVIGVIGIGMVALPAGLLASGFPDQLHERRGVRARGKPDPRERHDQSRGGRRTARTARPAWPVRSPGGRDRALDGASRHGLSALRRAARAGWQVGAGSCPMSARAGAERDPARTQRRLTWPKRGGQARIERAAALRAAGCTVGPQAALKRTSATRSIARAIAGSTSSWVRILSRMPISARLRRLSTAITSQASA
jgi:hypothetical protein